jgi:CRP-like cAMP-binding protein
MEEITERAERLQSLAGATLGPLGEIDEISRNQLLDQLEVRVAHPRQAVAAQGEELNGVALVCAGTIELLDDTDAPWKSLGPGDLLFARAVLEGRAAPCRARAGAGGALLLVGEQGLAQALIAESPSLATFLSTTNE